MIQQMKVLQAQGYTVSDIADSLGCDRKTVRTYLQRRIFPRLPL
ncbi:helix-turn-helix domain-containing protein [Sulfobacillus thermosulfidooxidans]|nr:helix-turn-helix domain-containing protein [Sulfobacillus thermosulfidooxidans]